MTIPLIGLVVFGTRRPKLEIVLPGEIVVLQRPIRISKVLEYKDGGSTAIEIVHAHGKVFQFCVPVRERHVLIGTLNPSDKTAFPLPYEHFEEILTISDALKSWTDSRATPAEQKELKRRRTIDGLSKDEAELYRVLMVRDLFEHGLTKWAD